jgi:hypothetical protein
MPGIPKRIRKLLHESFILEDCKQKLYSRLIRFESCGVSRLTRETIRFPVMLEQLSGVLPRAPDVCNTGGMAGRTWTNMAAQAKNSQFKTRADSSNKEVTCEIGCSQDVPYYSPQC